MEFRLLVSVLIAAGLFCSCDKDLVSYKQGDLKITVKKGSEWLHDFPLFAGIKMKNPPQIAIWAEDMNGNYLTTIYASHKIATESWMDNKGNRRKEALPVWCYARGIKYTDGLYLPTKEDPLTDGISGATPHDSFDVKIAPLSSLEQFVIKAEFNHSVDWNDHYPKNASEGNTDYSGGKKGSGQPSVVYSATVDLDSNQKQFIATLIGHSSPDGTDGIIYPDTSQLTTALEIVKELTVNIE